MNLNEAGMRKMLSTVATAQNPHDVASMPLADYDYLPAADRTAGDARRSDALAGAIDESTNVSPFPQRHPERAARADADQTWLQTCSRLLDLGAESVPDRDLLALLLSYSGTSVDPRAEAERLLSRFETLAGAVNAHSEGLGAANALDDRAVTLFQAVRAAVARLVREEISERPVIGSWQKLIDYLRATMAHQRVEQFRILFLDRSNVLIADEVQHKGTIDHTPVYPREVLKRALELDASAVIMVHNHPSNQPKPSKGDIQMTKQVQDALEMIGIVLHDHIIVSRRGHSSFRTMGLLKKR